MEQNSITGHIGNLEIDYDEDADVLYVAIDAPRVANTFDASHGLLLRKDPRTQAIVGVTILHYAGLFKTLLDRTWLKKLHLPSELERYLLSA